MGARTRAPVDRTEVRESGCPGRMRTSGRGRSAHAGRGGAELAWGTYSRRWRVGRAGPFLLASDTGPVREVDVRPFADTHSSCLGSPPRAAKQMLSSRLKICDQKFY